jgi:hypothetical protein
VTFKGLQKLVQLQPQASPGLDCNPGLCFIHHCG